MNTLIVISEYVYNYFNSPLGRLEFAASVITLINVIMIARANVWNYIPGTVGVILFGILFYEYKLYADSTLQLGFYLPAQIVGFWIWMYRGDQGKDSLEITALPFMMKVVVGLVAIPVIQVVGYLYLTYTDASFPFWDSAILVLSIIATILLTYKIADSWILWVVVDVIAIQVYYRKELYVTSGLYVVFLAIALYGCYNWFKQVKDETYA